MSIRKAHNRIDANYEDFLAQIIEMLNCQELGEIRSFNRWSRNKQKVEEHLHSRSLSKLADRVENGQRWRDKAQQYLDMNYKGVWQTNFVISTANNLDELIAGFKKRIARTKYNRNLPMDYIFTSNDIDEMLQLKKALWECTVFHREEIMRKYPFDHAFGKDIYIADVTNRYIPYVTLCRHLGIRVNTVRWNDGSKITKEDYATVLKAYGVKSLAKLRDIYPSLHSLGQKDKPILEYAVKVLKLNEINDRYDIDGNCPYRSKPEAWFASLLLTHGFVFGEDFKYEPKISIEGAAYHVDFSIKADAKRTIYIEIWGRKNTAYLERKQEKIAAYTKAGIEWYGIDYLDHEQLWDFLDTSVTILPIDFRSTIVDESTLAIVNNRKFNKKLPGADAVVAYISKKLPHVDEQTIRRQLVLLVTGKITAKEYGCRLDSNHNVLHHIKRDARGWNVQIRQLGKLSAPYFADAKVGGGDPYASLHLAIEYVKYTHPELTGSRLQPSKLDSHKNAIKAELIAGHTLSNIALAHGVPLQVLRWWLQKHNIHRQQYTTIKRGCSTTGN